jgi:hypothetical protein
MAFKDFGARFMAAVMSHYLQKNQREIRHVFLWFGVPMGWFCFQDTVEGK